MRLSVKLARFLSCLLSLSFNEVNDRHVRFCRRAVRHRAVKLPRSTSAAVMRFTNQKELSSIRRVITTVVIVNYSKYDIKSGYVSN